MELDDEHPLIVEQKKLSGGTMADRISDSEISAQFLYMDPASRAASLLKIDQEFGKDITADNEADLRKRAQLMSLARDMRKIDYMMRKAGR